MHALVNIALRAARDAAGAIAHSSDRLDRVKILQDDNGILLTSMDMDADKTLQYHLQKAYPEHGILSRASGEHPGEEGEPVWLLDPLAGNRNFISGYNQFAVSMACQINGRIEHAVIVNPITQEEFFASRGAGAQLNTQRMRVSSATDLDNALVALDADQLDDADLLHWQKQLLAANARSRISGCSTLDICAAACGQLQGGLASNYDVQEHGGAILILQEAGGFIGSEKGSPDIRNAKHMLFGNQKTFRELVKLA